MVWQPPHPNPQQIAALREKLVWPEERLLPFQESISGRPLATTPKTQRWYHPILLPLCRKLLWWQGRRRLPGFWDGLSFRIYRYYWDYNRPYPEGDFLLALRTTHEAALKNRQETKDLYDALDEYHRRWREEKQVFDA